jgi:hypothetical protein
MRNLALGPITGISALLVICAGLLTAACGSRSMERAGSGAGVPADSVRLDDHHFLGTPFTVENLTVWPVHTDQPLDVGEFLTLQEAQAQGVAAVREIGGGGGLQQNAIISSGLQVMAEIEIVDDGLEVASQADVIQTDVAPSRERQREGAPAQDSGTDQALDAESQALTRQTLTINVNPDFNHGGGAEVNTLVIENTGTLPLLVCAGTIVKGGNQDRQIGQDIVIAAGATVPVDAFCVEQGRWTNVRDGVANSGEFVAMKYVASKGVRTKGQFLNDQSGVWSEVATQRAAARVDLSVAGAAQRTTLVDSLDHADDARKQARDECVATIRAHFDALRETDAAPVGFAYAVNGDAQGVRVFAHDRLFRQNLDAFALSVAVEAETAEQTDFEEPTAADVVALVQAIEKDADAQRKTTRAANFNVLKQNPAGFNGNCFVEDEDGNEFPVTRDWTRK